MKTPLPPVVVDSREQKALRFSGLATVGACLETGDYSIEGYEDTITVERKSLDDLASCCGVDRHRFMAQVDRLLSIPSRLLLVEANWVDIAEHRYHSRINPQSITSTLFKLMSMGLPVLMGYDPENAGKACLRFLKAAYRQHDEEGTP